MIPLGEYLSIVRKNERTRNPMAVKLARVCAAQREVVDCFQKVVNFEDPAALREHIKTIQSAERELALVLRQEGFA